MKKLLIFFITAVILVSSFNAFAYTVDDAYDEIKSIHPEFIDKLSSQNVTKESLIRFIVDMQSYMTELNKKTKITEENFEKNAIKAVIDVSSRDEHLFFQDALIVLFPNAIKEIVTTGKIPDEFKPLTDTIKRIVFQNEMIGNTSDAGNENTEEHRFTDVDSSFWCYKAIITLADNFILSGYLDKTFKPDKNITRAEFAKIIVSATDTLNVGATASFNDVTKEDWYYSHVASAVEKGYIKGYPDNSFRPDENITRADIATVVYRCIKDKLKTADTVKFSDDASIPLYAKEAVYALSANGIINGMGDGSFAPLDEATRAQTAKIIYAVFFENRI